MLCDVTTLWSDQLLLSTLWVGLGGMIMEIRYAL